MVNNKLYEKYKNIINATIFLIITLLIIGIVFDFHFENGDDQQMANIAYGYFNGDTTKLVFINTIIGGIIKMLLFISPSIPWYAVLQLLIIFCSVWIIYYLMFKKMGNKAILPIIIFVSIFGYQILCVIQFTKTAAIGTVAGLLWIYDIHINNDSKYKFFLAGLIVILSSFYRFNMFGMMMVLLSCIGIYLIIKYLKNKDYNSFFHLTIPLVVLFVAALGLYKLNGMSYFHDDWSKYREYNNIRSSIVDSNKLEYRDHKEFYDSINFTKNDVEVLYEWEYLDLNVYSLDTLKKIDEYRNQFNTNISLKGFVYAGYRIVKNYYVYIIASLLMLLMAYKALKDKGKLIIFASELLLVAGLDFYLYSEQRYILNRLQVSIFCTMFLINCIYVFYEYEINTKKYVKYTAIVVSVIVALFSNYKWKNAEIEDKTISIRNNKVRNYFADNLDNTYLTMARGNLVLANPFNIFENKGKDYNSNVVKIASWDAFSPDFNNHLSKLNINNVYQDVIDNKHMFMCKEGDLSREIQYINEHYDETAKSELVYSIEGYNIYRVISNK